MEYRALGQSRFPAKEHATPHSPARSFTRPIETYKWTVRRDLPQHKAQTPPRHRECEAVGGPSSTFERTVEVDDLNLTQKIKKLIKVGIANGSFSD